jgi:hypothetical protein
MDDGAVLSLQRRLVEMAEHARAELQGRPKPKTAKPPERPTDEFGERVTDSGQVAPDWVRREVKAFLSTRLAFERVASPELRWAAARTRARRNTRN